MSSTADSYLGLSYRTLVAAEQTTDGDTVYVASHPDLDGCMAHGDTPEEALANLEDARRLYIETLVERGLRVPLPGSTVPKAT